MEGKPKLLYKTLVVGIIVIFVGVGIQPAFADVSKISISDSEDDCDLCPKVNKQHIDRLKTLIDRLDTINTKLSKVSKLNPEIEERYQEISERITTLTEMKEKYLSNDEWPFPFIRLTLCIILAIIEQVAWGISLIFAIPIAVFENYYRLWNIMRILFGPPMIFFANTAYGIFKLMEDLGCIPPDH